MGIKEDYAKAVTLAKDSKYIEARSLLIEYNNPKTDALLDKLNKSILADRVALRAKRNNKSRRDKKQTFFSGCMRRISFALVSVFAVCGLLFALSYFLPPLDEPTENQETIREIARVESTATVTGIANDTSTPTLTPTQTAFPTNTPLWIPTITNTPAPTGTALPTNIPLPTLSPIPITYYITNESVFVRDCPRTTCDRVTSLFLGDVIQILDTNVQGENVLSGTRWMQGIVYGQLVYVHSSLVSTIQPAPIVQQSSGGSVFPTNNTSSSSQTVSRPANCTEARAMGLSAVQAAQWNHLDRDNDGVACYGD